MFRNRFGLLQKISRILRARDLHLLLTSVARDLGTDVAGGSRRRRQTENWEQRRAGDKKSGTARHSFFTPLEFCPQLLVEWNTISGANLLRGSTVAREMFVMEWADSASIKILHFKHDVAVVCRGGALTSDLLSVAGDE